MQIKSKASSLRRGNERLGSRRRKANGMAPFLKTEGAMPELLVLRRCSSRKENPQAPPVLPQ